MRCELCCLNEVKRIKMVLNDVWVGLVGMSVVAAAMRVRVGVRVVMVMVMVVRVAM